VITIVWKLEDITKRSDSYRVQRVTAVRILRNGKPRTIGSRTFSFESDFQALLTLLEEKKALPPRAFARHAGGPYAFPNASVMADAGIANCIQL
jgi:hypothetical protein